MNRNIGALRHRVTILGETLSATGAGSYTRGKEVIAMAWAEVTQSVAAPADSAARRVHRTVFRVRVRARPGLAAAVWIRFKARDLRVRAVIDDDPQGRFLIFTCEEERPQ